MKQLFKASILSQKKVCVWQTLIHVDKTKEPIMGMDQKMKKIFIQEGPRWIAW